MQTPSRIRNLAATFEYSHLRSAVLIAYKIALIPVVVLQHAPPTTASELFTSLQGLETPSHSNENSGTCNDRPAGILEHQVDCCVSPLQVRTTAPDWYTSLLICIMREVERVNGQAFCAQSPMAESLRNFARSR